MTNQVPIKTIGGTILIDYEQGETWVAIKQRISERNSFPVHNQQLYIKGQPVDDSTVVNYDIHRDGFVSHRVYFDETNAPPMAALPAAPQATPVAVISPEPRANQTLWYTVQYLTQGETPFNQQLVQLYAAPDLETAHHAAKHRHDAAEARVTLDQQRERVTYLSLIQISESEQALLNKQIQGQATSEYPKMHFWMKEDLAGINYDNIMAYYVGPWGKEIGFIDSSSVLQRSSPHYRQHKRALYLRLLDFIPDGCSIKTYNPLHAINWVGLQRKIAMVFELEIEPVSTGREHNEEILRQTTLALSIIRGELMVSPELTNDTFAGVLLAIYNDTISLAQNAAADLIKDQYHALLAALNPMATATTTSGHIATLPPPAVITTSNQIATGSTRERVELTLQNLKQQVLAGIDDYLGNFVSTKGQKTLPSKSSKFSCTAPKSSYFRLEHHGGAGERRANALKARILQAARIEDIISELEALFGGPGKWNARSLKPLIATNLLCFTYADLPKTNSQALFCLVGGLEDRFILDNPSRRVR